MDLLFFVVTLQSQWAGTPFYEKKMKRLKFWIGNARTVSLAQSLMPAVVAVVMAIGSEGFCLWTALAAVFGVVAAHLGMNLADDYFDYKADRKDSRKDLVRQGFRARSVKYPYLTDKTATPRQLGSAIVAALGVAALAGAAILLFRPMIEIVIIALVTLFFGIFYSAPPFKFSYRGLGELVIGIIFGPLLMGGVYAASAGRIDPFVVFISVPVGLLVVNILFTHSFIDQIADKASGKMTFAILLGGNKANIAASVVFNFLPFVIVIAGVAIGMLSAWYLLVLLILPRAIWLVRSLVLFSKGREVDLEKPKRFLGRMENWEGIRKSGIDWFMIRWYCARNICSGFCLMVVIVNLILL